MKLAIFTQGGWYEVENIGYSDFLKVHHVLHRELEWWAYLL